MAPSSQLLLLLQLLSCISPGLACFCERYSWGPWSACTRTCNGGHQERTRNFIKDNYFWLSSCNELCPKVDRRACNQQVCPINCLLTEFGPWSDCSPCARKQYRTRAVQRPNQFGGSACSTELTEERPCIPLKECIMPPVKCKDKFKCDNGRCLDSALRCNGQNDCLDNSDERGCPDIQSVCPTDRRVAPGSDLPGNGFDALSGEQKGAVLDNTFMGGDCTIIRPRDLPHLIIYFRVPYNFHSFSIKVGAVDDFAIQPREVRTHSVILKPSSSKHGRASEQLPYDQPTLGDILARMFTIYLGGVSSSGSQSYRDLFDASKTMDSKFFRVHQVLPVSTFRMKEPADLVLSLPFLRFLHALPLDYNYALYREIFQRFGTHYYNSGTLGGHYDMLYQYDRQELVSSGETEEHTSGCLNKDSTFTVILYTQQKRVNRCTDTKITQKYRGSYIQASKRTFSKVRGGGAREAGALSFERHDPAPNKDAYKNWAKSVIENPALVENKVLPLIDLVRGIPCAATKRRHLKKALRQYLEEFDPCKCNPCPNNGRPILSGTECKCVCPTGTFGTNCEIRAPDYTSEAVDGYWSCWGPWSGCGASMRRKRTRQCNNPYPIRGGQPCDGPSTEEDPCHISIFENRDTCENDDDFTVGWIDELPPGVQGCLRPQRPANSFLRKSKQYYNFGEDEEFQCFSGFHLEGFQFINCHSDGTWSQPAGKCIRNICLPPELPAGISMLPVKEEYSVGDTLRLNCNGVGQWLTPHSTFTCSDSLTWEPALLTELRCTRGETVVPTQCGPGQRLEGTQCVCVPRESCLSEPADVCVLNVNVDAMVSMSLCSYQAGRCHNDPLFFVSEGVCDPTDEKKLEWAKFRAKMSSKSSVQVPCGPDTCYEWETCSALKTCVCKPARDCPRDGQSMSCVRMTRTQSTRSLTRCSMAALKCANYGLEIIYDGPCLS